MPKCTLRISLVKSPMAPNLPAHWVSNLSADSSRAQHLTLPPALSSLIQLKQIKTGQWTLIVSAWILDSVHSILKREFLQRNEISSELGRAASLHPTFGTHMQPVWPRTEAIIGFFPPLARQGNSLKENKARLLLSLSLSL